MDEGHRDKIYANSIALLLQEAHVAVAGGEVQAWPSAVKLAHDAGLAELRRGDLKVRADVAVRSAEVEIGRGLVGEANVYRGVGGVRLDVVALPGVEGERDGAVRALERELEAWVELGDGGVDG